jgi:hypothetical protein
MSFIDCADAELDARIHRMCAPLFATEQFLKQGHDVSTTSATVTFVKFEGRIFGVTCHHVLSAFYAIAMRDQRRIIPTIHSGPAIHHIGQVTDHGGYRWAFQSCREFLKPADVDDSEAGVALDRRNSDKPDIAIAELTTLWSLLQNFRSAEAIDLDSWIEPDWSATQPVAMAFGYPDDHKYRAGDKIAAPMPRVSAELGNRPSADKPQFALCSTLPTAHGWGFSGLSGGPIVIADTIKDRYTVIGITFEGNPSAKEFKPTQESFLRAEDILLMGHYLSPDRFRDWLNRAQYPIEFPAGWPSGAPSHDETEGATPMAP